MKIMGSTLGQSMNRELIKLAVDISRILIKEGFIIQRYDSYSTNSIYLKLDYGLCNSIRISDHPGKRYLKYRYNIGTYILENNTVIDGYERNYYRSDNITGLICDIFQSRTTKKLLYGDAGYQKMLEKNLQDNVDRRGFWQKAIILNGRKGYEIV